MAELQQHQEGNASLGKGQCDRSILYPPVCMYICMDGERVQHSS